MSVAPPVVAGPILGGPRQFFALQFRPTIRWPARDVHRHWRGIQFGRESMDRLKGKIALITGAGTGVGRACMKLFAAEGAKVVGVSRTKANLDETLAQVKAAGGEGQVERPISQSRKGPRRRSPKRS